MSKYIDADKLEKDGWSMQRIRQVSLTEMVYEVKKPTDFPAADVMEVIRCKDCAWFNACVNGNAFKIWDTDDFCSYAVRRDS